MAAAVLAAVAFAVTMGSQTRPPVGRGVRAPDFTLPRVAGEGALALSELADRVVLVNFWATWCKPCEDEMPAMERLYRQLRPAGLELLAVSVDEDAAPVEAFRRRLGLSFPILLDPDQRVADAYQTYRFPESLLVGRDGVIVERYVGPREWDAPEYLARIRRLLSPELAGARGSEPQ